MGFKVKDKFRTNPLSLTPGGCTVIVQLKNGKRYEYDKVKFPSAYKRVVEKNPEVSFVAYKRSSEV